MVEATVGFSRLDGGRRNLFFRHNAIAPAYRGDDSVGDLKAVRFGE